MQVRATFSVLTLCSITLTILACDRTTNLTDAGVHVLSLEVVSGDAQEGPVGQELPNPLVVKALDEKGKPIKDQLVNFRVVTGAGSMFAGASITDKDGLAQDFWTLGPEPGENVVEARAVDPTMGEKQVFARFTATGTSDVMRFIDEASFLAASGAMAVVVFPNPRGLTAAPYTENGVTLRQAAGFNNEIADLTPVLPGLEFGVSGAENIDIDFGRPVHALGLWMQDGFAIGEVRAQGRDSRFEFTFMSAGEVVAAFLEDPPIDEAFFFGVTFAQPVDRLEIREFNSVFDDLNDPFNENDFIGLIYTSPLPVSNTALDFSDAWVTVPDHSDLDLGATFTIEAWIKPRNAGGGPQHVVSKWGTCDAASYSLTVEGGKVRAGIPSCADGTLELASSSDLVNDQWQHIAVTLSPGEFRLYINGIQDAVVVTSRVAPVTTKPLSIGREGPPFNGWLYDGLIDEVRVWNIARTAGEISSSMNTRLAGNEAGLVGYWPFEEGTGDTAFDATGRGHDGQLGSAVGSDANDPQWTGDAAPIP